MRGPLRSLLRVRFLWLPGVVLLFTAALLAVGNLPGVGGATAVVAAGFASVVAMVGMLAVLTVGFSRSPFR